MCFNTIGYYFEIFEFRRLDLVKRCKTYGALFDLSYFLFFLPPLSTFLRDPFPSSPFRSLYLYLLCHFFLLFGATRKVKEHINETKKTWRQALQLTMIGKY